MVTNLLVAGTAAEDAEASVGFQRDDLKTDEPVEATPLEPDSAGFVDPSTDQVWDGRAAATELPEPASVRFDLDNGIQRPAASQAEANEVPVSVSRPAHRGGIAQVVSGSVRVEVLDTGTTHAAGVAGLLLRLDSNGSGPVDLTVNYAQFADLFGAGWGSRLQIVELPACAATTPAAEGCLEVTPLPSQNHAPRQTVSTSLQLSSSGTEHAEASDSRLLAVTAASSDDEGGDYRATDLSPAGSWTSGGNDGAFTYSYPLQLPPSAGPTPAVSLGYSSASHDGQTSGTNTQASWIGDGWGYEPGYIERSYKPCSLDDGGNTPDQTGDLCWDGGGNSLTMSLNGSNTTLVHDDSSGEWRAEADANWRIEHLGSPASNSGGTSERWKITTTDGTRYFFASEVSASSSRLTVPVFGNHSGEPCRSSGFKGSSCRQAYRWLLDKVIDVHGNMVRYFYNRETGYYGAAADPDNRMAYHRASHLVRIDYGLRSGDSSVPATGRVVFASGNRCLSNCGTTSDPNEDNWPDTPWDLRCDSTPCTSQHSPTFFAAKRLTKITTQVRDGDGFRDVDSWRLAHEFKDYGDEEQVVLWLKLIQHTGHVGQDVTLPMTEFAGEALPNRVDAAAGVPVMWRWRMSWACREICVTDVRNIRYDR